MERIAPTVKPARKYDATRRQERARETRRVVVDIARRRFLADGYTPTTIGAIAEEANVSVETVYKAFGNKAGILKAVFDVAVVGDDEPVPLADREEIRQARAEPDPRVKIEMFASIFTSRAGRMVPVELLARDAAAGDAGAAAVWKEIQAERLTGMANFAQHLHQGGHLRADVSMSEARDVLWTHNSPELWELLVMKRGWKPARFRRWVAQQLIAALLS
jgi:AcrR family transcriptional regulator